MIMCDLKTKQKKNKKPSTPQYFHWNCALGIIRYNTQCTGGLDKKKMLLIKWMTKTMKIILLII